MTSSIDHRPKETWAFDESVADCFRDMLERSIPGYEEMRALTMRLGKRFYQRDTLLVDVGASLGGGFEEHVVDVRVRAIESAPAMLARLRRRYGSGFDSNVEIVEQDLCQNPHVAPAYTASVVQAILTLQFLPFSVRNRVIRSAAAALQPGGAFLLVEKVKAPDHIVAEYRSFKHRQGYSWEAIEAKEQALDGVLVPATTTWIEDALVFEGGFDPTLYWRNLNFAAWIAVKR